MAPSFTEWAHAVAHCHAVSAARALDRTMIDREDHCFALHQRHNLHPRLHPWPLFGQDKFATSKILPRIRKQESRLKRKIQLAVQVLVQAIIVARTVAEN